MKKGICGLIFFLLTTLFMETVWAQSPAKVYTWDEKLARGGLNIVTSPVEVAREIHNTTEEKNLVIGWTIGLLRGFGSGFLRFAAGVADVFTCPFNFPEGNKGPLVDPEFVWQKPGPKYI